MPEAPARPGARRGRDDDDLKPVAGGGLLHRRVLLKRGLVLASASATSAGATANDLASVADAAAELPPWMRTPGQPFSSYGVPSAHEATLIRRIGANRAVPGNGVSWTDRKSVV